MFHRLRDNHVWTSQYTRFKSLTLKMKVNDVDDLDENWQTNVSYQVPCVCRHLHFSVRDSRRSRLEPNWFEYANIGQPIAARGQQTQQTGAELIWIRKYRSTSRCARTADAVDWSRLIWIRKYRSTNRWTSVLARCILDNLAENRADNSIFLDVIFARRLSERLFERLS